MIFFAVDKFRYATLELLSSSINDDYYLVEGNLTIKGITKSVSFKMYKNDENFKVWMVFDRSDFNVKYKLARVWTIRNIKNRKPVQNTNQSVQQSNQLSRKHRQHGAKYGR